MAVQHVPGDGIPFVGQNRCLPDTRGKTRPARTKPGGIAGRTDEDCKVGHVAFDPRMHKDVVTVTASVDEKHGEPKRATQIRR